MVEKKATKKQAKAPTNGKKRPFKRTKEIEEKVLAAMSVGTTLTQICKEVGISTVAWGDWRRKDKELDIAHGRARDEGYDAIAEDTITIADDGRNDYMAKLAEDGDERAAQVMAYNAEHVQRSKLRIETRLKLLAKWDPRRYGDRIALEHDIGGNLAETLKARREKVKKHRAGRS